LVVEALAVGASAVVEATEDIAEAAADKLIENVGVAATVGTIAIAGMAIETAVEVAIEDFSAPEGD